MAATSSRGACGEFDEVSGAPRILADLREDGEVISRKTVAKMMRKLGLRGICPRQWRTTTQREDGDTYPADVTKRQWDTGVLNAVWVGDISYLRTWEGWLYLATVIDAHSRRMVGWAIADHMRTDLVEDALKMAIALRGELPATVVFHTDRGTQYASEQITTFAAEHSITRSMGYTGVWDNAMAESFFSALKNERVYRTVYATKAQARRNVIAYTEGFYNPRRRHSALGYRRPDEVHYGYLQPATAA